MKLQVLSVFIVEKVINFRVLIEIDGVIWVSGSLCLLNDLFFELGCKILAQFDLVLFKFISFNRVVSLNEPIVTLVIIVEFSLLLFFVVSNVFIVCLD